MLETLYSDFTTKVLPKVSEGLMMTKDYFTDLFGRYVMYLIITDIISIVALLGAILTLTVGSYKLFHWGLKKHNEAVEANRGRASYNKEAHAWFIIPILACCSIIPLMTLTTQVVDTSKNLAKVLTVPEVRVYEELKPLMQ